MDGLCAPRDSVLMPLSLLPFIPVWLPFNFWQSLFETVNKFSWHTGMAFFSPFCKVHFSLWNISDGAHPSGSGVAYVRRRVWKSKTPSQVAAERSTVGPEFSGSLMGVSPVPVGFHFGHWNVHRTWTPTIGEDSGLRSRWWKIMGIWEGRTRFGDEMNFTLRANDIHAETES